ncbi:PREDICTED: guanine nucleotide exchange factor DBS-like [Cyprinodon variegatus]|uniref:guanine nucleotide exchange factor DBS-like n=1 Tax=Cyprinodon variegatus TaxID=28743 RepID=UPI000742A1D3|nr:PREDICTED: guanine nucleotide exchange factor DBS-like [Cyprinodon variegatus]
MLCWMREDEMSVQELLQRVQCVIAHVDEIMQQEIRPLLAVDIIEQLHRQFALLSGGRGKDGAPIITFPEYSGFSEVPEEDFLNVVTYLTSIPSLDAASIGFIIIIDRRKDKWSSVKASLSRIAGAFPGNLQLVLVLRPSRFFQRTIADIGIKLHKDDFKMKVVMLNSLADLHGYVDKSQLTQEFGGSLEYSHSQWIHHRTAIENFALTVKTTAQMLQRFGTELAETELPNDVQSTKDLLSAHTEKHNNLKEELKLALRQGNTLFACIKDQAAKSEDHRLNPDELENQTTVERLLAQLDETENAFEQFWSKHHLKLEQCLQLRHFEHDFREIKVSLDHLMDSLRNVPDAGDCVARVEHLLKEIKALEENAQINQWCESGIYLLASQAVDKCQSQEGAESALIDIQHFLESAEKNQVTELRNLHNQYESVLSEDIKGNVLRALKRLEDVQEMIEKRQVSLKRLSAKQTRPIQPVAPRPESSPKRPTQKNPSRTPVGQQALARKLSDNSNSSKLPAEADPNKKKNIRRTKGGIKGYVAELNNSELSHLIPPSLENKKEQLFGNLPEIYDFHNKTFLMELENCAENPELVGTCFLKRKEELQVYEKYCQNKPRSEVVWRQCGDSPFFQECQKKLDHKLSLDAYLLKPVQRITKYQLLLKEMLKCSKDEGIAELEEALATMLEIIKSVNDSMHQIAITGFEGNLSELGKLLMQGSFNVWTDHKRGHSKVKDLARFKPMQRHLFLYDKMLLFCKKREETSEGHEKTPSYSFKHSLKMSSVGITENVKGDHKKFEVWYNGREEVYIIQGAVMFKVGMLFHRGQEVTANPLMHYCRTATRRVHRTTAVISTSLRIADSALRSDSQTCPSVCPCRIVRKMALRHSDSSSPESGLRRANPSPNMRQKKDTLRGAIAAGGKRQSMTSSISSVAGSKAAVPRSTSQPGWTQRRLPSMDTEDFETIPSSGEESSNSSEDESSNKNADNSRYRVQLTYAACEAKDLSLETKDMVQFLEEAETGN